MEKPLEKEFKFFLDHQDELAKKYRGKFIVIKDQVVIGIYESQLAAYNETIKVHQIGTFLIQLCLPSQEIPTQTFHSRVIFTS